MRSKWMQMLFSFILLVPYYEYYKKTSMFQCIMVMLLASNDITTVRQKKIRTQKIIANVVVVCTFFDFIMQQRTGNVPLFLYHLFFLLHRPPIFTQIPHLLFTLCNSLSFSLHFVFFSIFLSPRRFLTIFPKTFSPSLSSFSVSVSFGKKSLSSTHSSVLFPILPNTVVFFLFLYRYLFAKEDENDRKKIQHNCR